MFVIGNESCDLDSAASAISLAFFYTNLKRERQIHAVLRHLNEDDNYVFIPLLQISSDDRPLKTEVIFSLENNNIEYELVPDM